MEFCYNNVILGGGISGMVTASYIPESIVIMKDKGQCYAHNGPRFIYKTEYTEDFMDRIDFREEPTNITCAYHYYGVFYEEATKEIRESYILKTRGIKFLDVHSCMNSGKNKIVGYDMVAVYNHIYRKLLNENRILKSLITDIHPHYQNGLGCLKTHLKNLIRYKQLFNTISAEILNNLLGNKTDNKNKTTANIYMYFVKMHKTESRQIESNRVFHFVYYADRNLPYYRISNVGMGDDIVCIESLDQFIPEQYFSCDIMRVEVLPHAKITDNYGFSNFSIYNDIVNIGRYANMNNNIRVHDTIKQFEEGI